MNKAKHICCLLTNKKLLVKEKEVAKIIKLKIICKKYINH